MLARRLWWQLSNTYGTDENQQSESAAIDDRQLYKKLSKRYQVQFHKYIKNRKSPVFFIYLQQNAK